MNFFPIKENIGSNFASSSTESFLKPNPAPACVPVWSILIESSSFNAVSTPEPTPAYKYVLRGNKPTCRANWIFVSLSVLILFDRAGEKQEDCEFSDGWDIV